MIIMDPERAVAQAAVVRIEITGRGRPVLGLYWKIGGAHLIGEAQPDLVRVPAGTKEAQAPGRVEGRLEKGQATDMVPVVMGDDNQRLARRAVPHQILAERDDPGPGIADEQVVIGAKLDTGGVSAHPHVARGGDRVRAAHPPESEVGPAHAPCAAPLGSALASWITRS